MTFFRNLRLNVKISLLGVSSALITALALVGMAIWQSGEYNNLAQAEVNGLINSDLDHITSGVYNLVKAENDAIQLQVDTNLNVAFHVLEKAGAVNFSKELVPWNAVNQFTSGTSELQLPKMLINGQWLGQNADPQTPSLIVDEVENLIGDTVTIFQKMNENGDMLRVATTVRNENGQRAISTYIPASNPDGTPNIVIETILQGKTYHGRAFVVDQWYITAYQPIYDSAGTLAGMLYVGVKQKNAEERVRQAILQSHVGKTGYVYVVVGNGENRGHYVVSQNGLRDGEDLWDVKDNDGNYIIQMIINMATTLNPGELGTIRYRWQNPGELTPRWKVVRLAYYEPWDWVIGTGVYEDELQTYQAVLDAGRARMTRDMSLVGLVILLLVGLLGVYIAWTIVRPVQKLNTAVETIIQGDLNQVVEVDSRDEIGVLAHSFNQMSKWLQESMNTLSTNEKRFRALYHDNPAMFLTLDSYGKIISVNEFGAEQLGYDVNDLEGQSALMIYCQDDQPEALKQVLKCVQEPGEENHWRLRKIRKDGSIFWVEEFGRAIVNPMGMVNVLLVSHDVSETQQAEERLKAVNRQLENIIEFLPDATFIINEKKEIVAWNHAMEVMTGSV